MMRIPNPVARHNERVCVWNYRKKYGDWEFGYIECLRYENRFGDFAWTYDVVLDRRSPSGNPIRLYVGAGDIRAIKKVKR